MGFTYIVTVNRPTFPTLIFSPKGLFSPLINFTLSYVSYYLCISPKGLFWLSMPHSVSCDFTSLISLPTPVQCPVVALLHSVRIVFVLLYLFALFEGAVTHSSYTGDN